MKLAETNARLALVKQRPSIVAWGELLFDVFSDGPRIGGAAANVAFHARALGARAILVSRVGRDALGSRARDELARHGVDVRFVGVDDPHPTGTVNVALVDGEPRFTIGAQAAWDRIALDPALESELDHADAFVFGTLAQRSLLGSEALLAALGRLPPRCLRVADLNLRPPHVTERALGLALDHASIVKLNDKEATRVAAALGTSDPRAALFARGVAVVALTHGEAGAELHTRQSHERHPGYAALPNGDSVGAGDAFTATLTVEMCRGTPLPKLLARANRYASFVASHRGAMPRPSRELLDELEAVAV